MAALVHGKTSLGITNATSAAKKYAASPYLSAKDIRQLLGAMRLLNYRSNSSLAAAEQAYDLEYLEPVVVPLLFRNIAMTLDVLRDLVEKYGLDLNTVFIQQQSIMEHNPNMNSSMLMYLREHEYKFSLQDVLTLPSNLIYSDMAPFETYAQQYVNSGMFIDPIILAFYMRIMANVQMPEILPVDSDGHLSFFFYGILTALVYLAHSRTEEQYNDYGFSAQWRNLLVIEKLVLQIKQIPDIDHPVVVLPQELRARQAADKPNNVTWYRDILLSFLLIGCRVPLRGSTKSMPQYKIDERHARCAPVWMLANRGWRDMLIPSLKDVDLPMFMSRDTLWLCVAQNANLTVAFLRSNPRIMRALDATALLNNRLAFPEAAADSIDELCDLLMSQHSPETTKAVSKSWRVTDALVRKYADVIDYTKLGRATNKLTPGFVLSLLTERHYSVEDLLYMGDMAVPKQAVTSIAGSGAFDLRCYLVRILSVSKKTVVDDITVQLLSLLSDKLMVARSTFMAARAANKPDALIKLM